MAFYIIASRLNGLVLDVSRENTQSGAKVILWNRHGRDNQLWFDDPSTGTIRTKLDGFCLDIEGDQRLRVMPFQPGNPNQEWVRDPQGFIRNRLYPNKVLDIFEIIQSPGAEIVMWDQTNGPNQLWDFDFVGAVPTGGYPYPYMGGANTAYPYMSGAYPGQQSGQFLAQTYPGITPTGESIQQREFYIVNHHSGKVLDIKGGQGNSGDHIVLGHKGHGRHQLWFEGLDGFIRSALNGFAINAAPESRAEVEPFNGGHHQQWAFEGRKIVNRANGEVLDIYGRQEHDGSTVGSYPWKDSWNQHWEFEYV